MRKSRTPGSVRGVSGNGYPYRGIKGVHYDVVQTCGMA